MLSKAPVRVLLVLAVVVFAFLLSQMVGYSREPLVAQGNAPLQDEPLFFLEHYETSRFDRPSPEAMAPTNGPTAPDIFVPWSKVTYQFYENNNYEVYFMNDDGSGQVRLTNHTAADIHPRLNQDSTRVIFASNRDGDYELYTINSNGSGLQQLTFNNTDDVEPDWSPGGSKIVFQAYRDGQPEIYLMNTDGSGQTRLTHDPDYDGMPTWSPDGNKIAFTSRRTGGYRIYTMTHTGGGLIQLSNQPYSLRPAWSPDGNKIAYDADGNNDGFQEIWYMNADSSGQTARYVSATPLEDNLVRSWSPNGQYIAITTVEYIYYQGSWYWVNAYVKGIAWQGSAGPFYLLNGNNRVWYPDWQTQDSSPPQSEVLSLPYYLRASAALIRWRGSDNGVSGVGGYDVQYRSGGSWINWQNNSVLTYGWLSGAPIGVPLEFRSRVRDRAGNVESWPAQSDAETILYTWKLAAKVTDNRGVTLTNVPVSIAPTPINLAVSDANGLVEAWLKNNGSHALTVHQSGYKPVSATALNSEATHPFYLRPQDDIIVNGTFEATGGPVPGWSITGSLPGSVTTNAANTGSKALALGTTCPFPCLTSALEFPTSSSAYAPDIAVDAQNTLHMVWHDGLQGNGIYYRYRTNDGIWSDPLKLAGTSQFPEPQIAIDLQQRMHVMWTTYGSSLTTYYMNKPLNGTWSTPIVVSSTARMVNDLQVDRHNRLYVLQSAYIQYREANGNWSQSVPFVIDITNYASPGRMAIDKDGIVHLAWAERVDEGGRDLFYRRLLPDGTLLAPQEIMSGLGTLSTEIQKLVLGDDVLYLFFKTTHDGYFAQWTPQAGWSTPEAIDYSQHGVDALLDKQNVLHVFSRVYYGNGIYDSTYYRQWTSGQGWTQIVPFGGSFNGPILKMVMSSQGMLHLAWENHGRIMYQTTERATSSGNVLLQQTMTVSNNLVNPTLAFMMKGQIDLAGDSTGLAVVISNGVITQTTTPVIQPDWTLTWIDMSVWTGQTVTVTFSLHQAGGEHYLRLYLDDVSLGSSYPDTWLTLNGPISALPGTILEMTMRFGNRGQLFASDNQITVTLPANLSFVSASVAPVSTQPLVWDVGDLAGGSNPAPIVVTLAVQGSAPSMVTRSISAELEGAIPEVVLGNNQPVYVLFLGAKLFVPVVLNN